MLFPGQGSQAAGMREQVERWRPDLVLLARAAVGDDPFERADEGTRFAQPAIFCAALAGWRRLRDDFEPELMAGHSLGEISALVAAGAMDAEDGLNLVAARGSLMQEAAEAAGGGGMLAVSVGDRDGAAEAAGRRRGPDRRQRQRPRPGRALGAGAASAPKAEARCASAACVPSACPWPAPSTRPRWSPPCRSSASGSARSSCARLPCPCSRA